MYLDQGSATSAPMRIALISEHASPLATMGSIDAGGQNVYVSHVARSLARRGHSVDVFTRRDTPELPEVVDLRPGVRVFHIDAGPARFIPKEKLLPYMPAFSAGIQRVLSNPRAPRCDVVHANFFMSGLSALRLKASLNLPLVMTFHALGMVRREHQKSEDAFPVERSDIEQLLVQRADRIVAECPQDWDDLMRLYGARARNLSMVPCGIDVEEFRPMPRARARAALGLEQDEFVILQLGRLVPRKGIDNVIRALAHLPERMRVRLLVVGGESREPDEVATPEIKRLRDIARSCGVSDRVVFTGQRQRQELRAYYSAANVFVTTPWYEPFGITPLEAMACGTPVIGSMVGGIQYSVVDGVTGFLVPPKYPEALATYLVQLHDHPTLAEAMGRAGVRRVRSRFTWDHIAAQLADVYESVREPVTTQLPASIPDLHLVTPRSGGRRASASMAGSMSRSAS